MRAYRDDKRVWTQTLIYKGWLAFSAFENLQISAKIAFPEQTCVEVNMAHNFSELRILWYKFSFYREVLLHIGTKVLRKVL